MQTNQGASQPAADDLRIPGYEITARIGRGGMGVVYKARQVHLNREVAIKLMLDGDCTAPALARFRAEAKVLAGLRHPNIVQVYDAGVHDRRAYFVLEFIEGGSLDCQARAAPWEARAAAVLVAKLAFAIHACHEQGVLHRDLKPANVLLTAEGEPKVADFGLAKRLDTSTGLTASGAVLGTPAYMAPEQASSQKGTVTTAADVYGLGAILYELLTGRPPFQGATPLDIVLQVLEQEPAPPRQFNPKVNRDLETVCLKCLQKAPMRRYASARDLALDLERFLRGEPTQGRLPSWSVRAARWVAHHPVLATAVVCVVAQSLLYWVWLSLEPSARFFGSSFLLMGVAHTLVAAGVAWWILRAARPRARLWRVLMLFATLLILKFAAVSSFSVVFSWISDKDLLFFAYMVLNSGLLNGITSGLLCLAISAGVRWWLGGRWVPIVAGSIIGLWLGIAYGTLLSLIHEDLDFWMLGTMLVGLLAAPVAGSMIGAKWSRPSRVPNQVQQPTAAAITVSEGVKTAEGGRVG